MCRQALGDFCSLYAHLRDRSNLSVNENIRQGDFIGFEGGTTGMGVMFPSHLHLQTWLGRNINYNVHIAFNPLDLYEVTMTRNGIVGSSILSMDTSPNAYSWNWHFLRRHPNGTTFQRWNQSLNDPNRISELVTFLSSIDSNRTQSYLGF